MFRSYGIFETHWHVSVHAFGLHDSVTSLLDGNEMYMETLHIYRMSLQIGKIYMYAYSKVLQ